MIAPAAIGIRLGSSTLTLAVSRLGEGFDPRPSVLASDAGDRTTPALVARSGGEWVLGEAARQQVRAFSLLFHILTSPGTLRLDLMCVTKFIAKLQITLFQIEISPPSPAAR
jgi:molecular chaperone DnaK (HSP70)